MVATCLYPNVRGHDYASSRAGRFLEIYFSKVNFIVLCALFTSSVPPVLILYLVVSVPGGFSATTFQMCPISAPAVSVCGPQYISL